MLISSAKAITMIICINPIRPGLFLGVPGPGPPPPLHKSESIDAIVMKLGG